MTAAAAAVRCPLLAAPPVCSVYPAPHLAPLALTGTATPSCLPPSLPHHHTCAHAPQVIYVAPLKALVRERIKDWGAGFCRALGKRLVELTGDYTPDMVGGLGRGRWTWL